MPEKKNPNREEENQENKNNEINIGILVVHGIGDQKQFDCLKGIANDIVDYFQSEIDKGYVEVSVDINRATVGTFKSLHPAWQDGKRPPINVRIKPTGHNKAYNLELREVWWADLDRHSQNFGKFMKFWFWGLSLWLIPPWKNYPTLNDPENHLEDFSWHQNNSWEKNISRFIARIEYFLIGLFLLIAHPILYVFKTVGHFFDCNVPLTIVADYVGKIRLYQDSFKAGKDLIEDRENYPRFSIQRRMINALVRMAISDYDRWYVWSHSLGSVVAYNAFSMPEATLSHYVAEYMWSEINDWIGDREQSPGRERKKIFSGGNENDRNRRPRPLRPVWQKETISREYLFKKCEGLLTYGSPFWRIADLWSDLLKRNKIADFSPDFKWYNIIDPSDPVATTIEKLFSQQAEQADEKKYLHPKDLFYRTPNPFLFAHLSYFSPRKSSPLIGQLWRWMSEARNITEENNLYNSWYIKLFIRFPGVQDEREAYLRYHQMWRFIWWFLLITLFSFAITFITIFFAKLLASSTSLLADINNDWRTTLCSLVLQSFQSLWICILIGGVLVIIIGLLNRITEIIFYTHKFFRSLLLEYLQGHPNEKFERNWLIKKFGGESGLWRFFPLRKFIIINTLNRLDKSNKIRVYKETERNPETTKYFFPKYHFEFNEEQNGDIPKNELKNLERFVIDKLKFNPKKIEKKTNIFSKSYNESSQYYTLLVFSDDMPKYYVNYEVFEDNDSNIYTIYCYFYYADIQPRRIP